MLFQPLFKKSLFWGHGKKAQDNHLSLTFLDFCVYRSDVCLCTYVKNYLTKHHIFEIWPWQAFKEGILKVKWCFFELESYRKNARLLSEIRLRSFRSNSDGGGSCFRLPVGVVVNIGLLALVTLPSNLGMYFSSSFNSGVFDREFCKENKSSFYDTS